MKKTFPIFESDEEAERFVDTADLSEYDFSSFRPIDEVIVKTEAKTPETATTETLRLRLPSDMTARLAALAAKQGVSENDFVRDALEKAMVVASSR